MKILPYMFASFAITLAMNHLFAKAHLRNDEPCTHCKVVRKNSKQSCKEILTVFPVDSESGEEKALVIKSLEFAGDKFLQTAIVIKNKLDQDKSLSAKKIRALHNCLRLYQGGSRSFGFGLRAFRAQNYQHFNFKWLKGAQHDVVECERNLNMAGVDVEQLGIKSSYLLELVDAAHEAVRCLSTKLM